MCIVVGGVEREVRRGLVDGGWVLGGEMRGLVVVTDRRLVVVQVLLWAGLDGLDVLGDLGDLDLDDLDGLGGLDLGGLGDHGHDHDYDYDHDPVLALEQGRH